MALLDSEREQSLRMLQEVPKKLRLDKSRTHRDARNSILTTIEILTPTSNRD
jgi:hypothetical protein